jgi:hypothetical protein
VIRFGLSLFDIIKEIVILALCHFACPSTSIGDQLAHQLRRIIHDRNYTPII